MAILLVTTTVAVVALVITEAEAVLAEMPTEALVVAEEVLLPYGTEPLLILPMEVMVPTIPKATMVDKAGPLVVEPEEVQYQEWLVSMALNLMVEMPDLAMDPFALAEAMLYLPVTMHQVATVVAVDQGLQMVRPVQQEQMEPQH